MSLSKDQDGCGDGGKYDHETTWIDYFEIYGTCRVETVTSHVTHTFMSDNASSGLSIPAGIVVGLVASFIQSLGLTIQRKSHILNQALPEEQRRVEHRRP